MIARVGCDLFPRLAAVRRRNDRAAGANDDRVILVKGPYVGEGNISFGKLLLPSKTAVGRPKDRIVRTDRKSIQLVLCKMYRLQWIALRQRILPEPALLGINTYCGDG